MSAKPIPGYSMACGYLAHREWLLSRAIYFKLAEGREDWFRILAAAVAISEECQLLDDFVTVRYRGKPFNLYTLATTDARRGSAYTPTEESIKKLQKILGMENIAPRWFHCD
ncbi:hypothetical protein FIBSPDRAFT_1037832 [Athelia psychrophila]|uniref:Uncharacterized protein n=1 Tax=Athelia psychrophila TaxID=1759441 RepID=A0A166U7H0_9AGAM|nr:hypothetical protein FIBSPDRAFT_1037832 [Fibularhizoctonia sp. CBS 109695]